MTMLSPDPESIGVLSMCKRTISCLMQRCKCIKNDFVCLELCHLENLYPEDFVIDF